jgi:hypothetical protein
LNLIAALIALSVFSSAQSGADNPRLIPVANGWARNKINANIFRKNSVTTHGSSQYVSFYDADSNIVVAKRRLGSVEWQVHRTSYRVNTKDAHNSINIAVDGRGFLHVAWSEHNKPLQYCRSVEPGGLSLTDRMSMTGNREDRVTYPEFYSLPGGNLIFLYRDGASGNGDVMINRYDARTQVWAQIQTGFISGEGERNAYWQMAVTPSGIIHISWVWRESPDVATNHDICYAKSLDGGKTWQNSRGEPYRLPITAKSAEYAARISQQSDLINQTSMCVDSQGRPYIATYWRPAGTEVPQYQLVYHDGTQWRVSQITQRKTPFRLAGMGTKRIPISRPQIVVDAAAMRQTAYLLFSDLERGNRASVAVCNDLIGGKWTIEDLTNISLGMWEPTYDNALWESRKELHVFIQNVEQFDTREGEGERLANMDAQMVYILEWKPERRRVRGRR